LLSSAERARWLGFMFDHDRAAYLAAHALARMVGGHLLGIAPQEVTFTTVCPRCGGSHGKPTLPGTGLELSITHSRTRVGVAFARAVAVGLDVEEALPARPHASLAAYVLSARELATLARLPESSKDTALLRYWTRKEALLKATGHGLYIAPADVTVSGPLDAPALLEWAAAPALEQWLYLHDLHPDPGHIAAVATLGAWLDVTEHPASAMLAAGRAVCPPW
jgi:4'-phosphopantetheinyl transferase